MISNVGIQTAQQWRTQPQERIAWSLDNELNAFVYKHQGTEGRSNIAFAGIGSRNRSKVDLNDKIGLTVRFGHGPKLLSCGRSSQPKINPADYISPLLQQKT